MLIDTQLSAAGWAAQDKSALNLFAAQGVAVRESIMASGRGRAGYLLYVDKAAAGVIETKPEGTPPRSSPARSLRTSPRPSSSLSS